MREEKRLIKYQHRTVSKTLRQMLQLKNEYTDQTKKIQFNRQKNSI